MQVPAGNQNKENNQASKKYELPSLKPGVHDAATKSNAIEIPNITLPKGGGVISTWLLTMPKKIRPFDYNTISDVIFHISYTAEYGNPADVENRSKLVSRTMTIFRYYPA